MKITTNYALKKPDYEDVVDIATFNFNADTIDKELKSVTTTINQVLDKANSAFQSASDGKSTIANAITGKGGNANGGMTFDQLASAINAISTKNCIFGQNYRTDSYFTVSGLPFRPKIVITSNGNLLYVHDCSKKIFPYDYRFTITKSSSQSSIAQITDSSPSQYLTINNDGFYWKVSGGSGNTVPWIAIDI